MTTPTTGPADPRPMTLQQASDLARQALLNAKELEGICSDFMDKNNALRLEVLDMRQKMLAMIEGINFLDRIATDWEPDHSSGLDRQKWVKALDARAAAEKFLQAQAERMLTKAQPFNERARESIPPDVIQCAETVGRYFVNQGIEVWELGPVRNRFTPDPVCQRGGKCQCWNDCGDDPKLPRPRSFTDRP